MSFLLRDTGYVLSLAASLLLYCISSLSLHLAASEKSFRPQNRHSSLCLLLLPKLLHYIPCTLESDFGLCVTVNFFCCIPETHLARGTDNGFHQVQRHLYALLWGTFRQAFWGKNIMFFFPSFLIFTTQTSSYFILNPYGWQFWKIWIGDKKSFSLTKSVLHAIFRWQICHRNCHFYMKKAAMISSSLLLKWASPIGIEPTIEP